MPEISVIVPAGNAQGTLGRTLEALAAQDIEADYEVIVVDDASTDATPRIAAEGGAWVVTREVAGGPAEARNSGVAEARSPLLAFTDADCVPAPGWLRALHAALAGADLVTGPVEPDPAARRRAFDRTLHIAADSALFETANLAVTREAFDRVGGFEAFAAGPGHAGLRPGPGDGHFGEDVVFGWRALRSGARRAAVPDALVQHAVFPRSPRDHVASRWRLRFFPALVAEVPELRDHFFHAYFLSRKTALFDLAAAGVVAALVRRSPWPLVALAPYAREHLQIDRGWRRSVARRNAATVAGDAVGLVALVRGSIAARRALL